MLSRGTSVLSALSRACNTRHDAGATPKLGGMGIVPLPVSNQQHSFDSGLLEANLLAMMIRHKLCSLFPVHLASTIRANKPSIVGVKECNSTPYERTGNLHMK
jgi:hypothetical protein